jgi:hypothetical protein
VDAVDRFFNRLAAAGGVAVQADPPLPAAELRERLTAFVREYPAASAHPLWLDFLATHGGATVDLGPHSVILLGFDARICPDLTESEGPVIDAQGCLDFGLVSLGFPERTTRRQVELGFTFATDAAWRPGVYSRDEAGKPRWFAASFADWLDEIAGCAYDLTTLERR